MSAPGQSMYLKDKKTRITLRVNDEQMDFIKAKADRFGVSPSEYLRMIVNVNMYTEKEEGSRRANEETSSNDIIQQS